MSDSSAGGGLGLVAALLARGHDLIPDERGRAAARASLEGQAGPARERLLGRQAAVALAARLSAAGAPVIATTVARWRAGRHAPRLVHVRALAQVARELGVVAAPAQSGQPRRRRR